MDRRELLLAGGALAAGLGGGRVLAQGNPQAAPRAAGAVRKLQIDAYSRHLQWLRDPAEVAKAVLEMGYEGLDITVRPYPGHVDPEKVATELPAFVRVIRDHGVKVSTITCPITDADSPNAERILDTASKLDIKHYWWGTFRYDQAKPVMPQLDALKPAVAKLAALNAKYGTTAMYHNYSGPGMVGNAIWDMLYLLRDHDPRYVGFHFDTGHATNAGGNNTWALNMRAAGPYIAGLSIKDSFLERFDPATAPARPAGPPPGAPGQGGQRQGPPRDDGPPYPWRVKYTPLGEGNVNLPLLAQVLKEIGFSGPTEIQAEYPNGGADSAQDKLTLPRDVVLGAMKRDLQTLKKAWANTGFV